MKKNYLLLISLFFFCVANATNYYVDAVNGNNGNSGASPALAFITVQTAANLTNPGDTVFIMNGTYTSTGTVLHINRSGSAGATIVYTAYPGHAPKLQASANSYAVIFLSAGTSYITINGLELSGYGVNLSLAADTIPAKNQLTCPVVGSPATAQAPVQKYNGHGFTADSRSVTTGSHHIVITNNKVHDCGASGISFLNCDYITIEGNTTYNNSWYTIYGTSGISFNQSYNYDNNNTVYHNIVRNNTSYGNRMYVPFYNDCKVTDGNGIILDIAQASYTGKSLVENNITFNNGGSGIHSFKMNHVDMLHNISYLNSASPEINSSNIYALQSDDVRMINNIIVARPGKKVNGVNSSTNLTYDYNVFFGGLTPELVGAHSLIQDPKFVNPSTDPAVADFHLQAGSVAINNGNNSNSTALDKDGIGRPLNSIVEIGAYETSLRGSFITYGTQLNKVLGNAAGNGLGEGGAGYLYAPYESRPATANIKSRHAYIYPQLLLTTVPAGNIINSLQFRRAIQTSSGNTTPSTQTVPDNSIIKIYLRNETSDNFGTSAFDWTSLLPGTANPAVLVYGGEASPLIGASGGWKTVQFQVPFTYTGGHLGVYVEYLQKGNSSGATDINWLYDNGGSQPLYNITNYPNQLYATKTTASTGTISDLLSTSNERRPVMAVGYYSPIFLPVTLTQFSAVKSNKQVEVNWMVATEMANAGFDVQRSGDGSMFQTIGWVASKAPGGNSATPIYYQFTDAAPLNGNNYYRLRQTDHDGKMTYSRIVLVKPLFKGLTISSIYPNPGREKFSALVSGAEQTTATISIKDLQGRTIHQYAKVLPGGSVAIEIPMEKEAAGIYLLEIKLPSGEKMVEKFIKN